MSDKNPYPELSAMIGSNARARRLHLGVTQKQIAVKMGKSVEYYARVERGHALPSVPTLVDMADALQTSPQTLLQDAIALIDPEPMPEIADEIVGIVASARKHPENLPLLFAVLRALEDD